MTIQGQDDVTGVPLPLDYVMAPDRTPSEWLSWEVLIEPPATTTLTAQVPDVRTLALWLPTTGFASLMVQWASTDTPVNRSLIESGQVMVISDIVVPGVNLTMLELIPISPSVLTYTVRLFALRNEP
jgi:hypothetical protein